MKRKDKNKFKSESVLARNTEAGEIYVTQGGVTKTKDGKEQVWGFDRVLVKEITEKCVKVEAPWGVIVDLPLDYVMYTTQEKELKMTFIVHLIDRDRDSTEVLTFAEAVNRGLEQVQDEKVQRRRGAKKEKLEPKVVKRLLSVDGVSFSELATECGASTQFVRYIANQQEKKGYKLVKVGEALYRLEKK